MKKILFLSAIYCVVIGCDFKDSKGNAPLIEDANGNLVDNPNYVSDQQYQEMEKEKIREDEVKHIHESMKKWGDSAVEADKNKVLTDEEKKLKEEKIKKIKKDFNIE